MDKEKGGMQRPFVFVGRRSSVVGQGSIAAHRTVSRCWDLRSMSTHRDALAPAGVSAANAAPDTSAMSKAAVLNAPAMSVPTVRNQPVFGQTTGFAPSSDPCITGVPAAASIA